MFQSRMIDGRWTLSPGADHSAMPADWVARFEQQPKLEAMVPGCVHTAMMTAGWLDDPYQDQNETKQTWIGETDWVFEAEFEVDDGLLGDLQADEHLEMVFPSIDTVAEVRLNDRVIGHAQDMHVSWRFDVRDVLVAGVNRLSVAIRSPAAYAREHEARLGPLPYLNTKVPFNFIRKQACNFGWDWGPALATSGLWQTPRIVRWQGVRIEAVRPLVMSADRQCATVRVCVDVVGDVDAFGGIRAGVRLRSSDGESVSAGVGSILAEQGAAAGLSGESAVGGGGMPSHPGTAVIELAVHEPELWWPRGHGGQPLYTLEVELTDGAGRKIDGRTMRTGIRQVRLLDEPDEVGRRFAIEVNGRAVFCLGANWIPDDCFLDRACTPERYRARLEQACDLNMNMLRVWGGGIFETDTFYDLCDELGLMVWQDFLFACAGYPEEPPFDELVRLEAEQNVARLSRHPSLVLWNGCNENLWGYQAWGWKEQGKVAGRTWGPGYYFQTLDSVCRRLDPSRPYWPASPWSGDQDVDDGLSANLETHGNKHVWEAWFGEHYTAYRRFRPRFCSEFGFQGPGNVGTLGSAMSGAKADTGLDWSDATWWAHRQKSPGGDDRNLRHLEQNFVDPGPGDVRHYLLQLNQARALATGIEWFRACWPVCTGTLFWQLNDCWPAVSWSVLDFGGAWKPAAYAVRRAMAPRLLTIHPVEGELTVFAINDTDEPWEGNMAVSRLDFIGRPQYAGRAAVAVEPRSVQRIGLKGGGLVTPGEPEREFLLADCGGVQALWFFCPDREMRDEPVELDAQLEAVEGGYHLTLQARSLVRDVCLAVDMLDPAARVDEQWVTMLPEEPYRFTIWTQRKLTTDNLIKQPVFRTSSLYSGGAG